MKISVTVTGYIDVSDDWDDGQYSALDVADYRYNDQLTAEDALQELAKKMAVYPDDVEVRVRLPEVTEPLTIEQLREMDGEPVWVIYDQDAAKTTPGFDPLALWALVEVTKTSVFLTNNLGGRTAYADDQDLEWAGITVYRRPPEGEA